MRVHSGDTAQPERDRLALQPLDYAALALIVIALVVAPLYAGGFSTPIRFDPARGNTAMEVMGIPLVLMLAALAGVLVLWREIKRPVAIGAIPGLAGATLLMVGWGVVSLLRSYALYESVNTLASLLAAVLVSGLVSRLVRSRQGLLIALYGVVAAGTLEAMRGLVEYATYFSSHIAYHRVFADFANPDFLAGYLLLPLLTTLGAFGAAEGAVGGVLGICLFAQGMCLALTGSRAGAGIGILFAILWAGAVFALRSGPKLQKRAALAAGLVILSCVVGSTPTLSRFAPAAPSAAKPAAPTGAPAAAVAMGGDSQAHSTKFRMYTWSGTLRMARSNPILGTGIGTFDTAYPRYADTAFTAHAHNSYLQWAAETGVVGLLFLMAMFAATTAFGSRVLMVTSEDDEESVGVSGTGKFRLAAPRLALLGLLMAIGASLVHSFSDSDWYIVATLLTLGTVIGLVAGLSRDLAPLATLRPYPLLNLLKIAMAVACVALFWRAYSTATARMDEFQTRGEIAAMDADPEAALSHARLAASADPLDPEPELDIASMEQRMSQPDAARDALNDAVHRARIGKTWYRLGQFYAHSDQLDQAIGAFRESQALEPHNLQNLKALGDAQVKAGKTDDAVRTYHAITDLEHSPYGLVRAMPEMVETDFAVAHAALADIAVTRNDWAEAGREAGDAAAVLREFWGWYRRDSDVKQGTPPDKREAMATLYAHVLDVEKQAATHQGPGAKPSVAEIDREATDFQTWNTADKAESSAGSSTP